MEEIEKRLVKDFMTSDVISVEEGTPIEDVIKLIIEKKYNAFPVVRGRKLIGIVSKMDLIKMYSLISGPYANFWESRVVKDIMRRAVVTLSPRDPIKYAADLMVEYRVRSIPVVDEKSNLIGILSIGDVLKAFMEIKERLEDRLEEKPK